MRGLTEYINGPEAPTSGDELTFFITREMMREFSPRLMLVNFWDMDVAHWGSYSLYLQADHEDGPAYRDAVGRGAKRTRIISDKTTRADSAGAGARWRHQCRQWLPESSQRRSILPQYVDAGALGAGFPRAKPGGPYTTSTSPPLRPSCWA